MPYQNGYLVLCLCALSVCTSLNTNLVPLTKFGVDGESTLYVIGDTHGDENYLFRTLLATELFEIEEDEETFILDIIWKKDLADRSDQNFEVVVLGDIVDRGTKSGSMLLALRRLTQDETWGSHLKVLMGNHESMLLSFQTQNAVGDLDREAVKEAVQQKRGPYHELFAWMRHLPVAYISHDLLLMHGGLSEKTLDMILEKFWEDFSDEHACVEAGRACGDFLVKFLNEQSVQIHEKVDYCLEYNFTHADECIEEATTNQTIGGLLTHDPGGVLWYRGYSKISEGAGTPDRCAEAEKVGAYAGVAAMAIAHSTHGKITKFCADNDVPIFATDTHHLSCIEKDNCEYDEENIFHEGEINFNKNNVPQTLRVFRNEATGRMTFDDCFSKVGEDHEVEIKRLSLGDLPLPPQDEVDPSTTITTIIATTTVATTMTSTMIIADTTPITIATDTTTTMTSTMIIADTTPITTATDTTTPDVVITGTMTAATTASTIATTGATIPFSGIDDTTTITTTSTSTKSENTEHSLFPYVIGFTIVVALAILGAYLYASRRARRRATDTPWLVFGDMESTATGSSNVEMEPMHWNNPARLSTPAPA